MKTSEIQQTSRDHIGAEPSPFSFQLSTSYLLRLVPVTARPSGRNSGQNRRDSSGDKSRQLPLLYLQTSGTCFAHSSSVHSLVISSSIPTPQNGCSVLRHFAPGPGSSVSYSDPCVVVLLYLSRYVCMYDVWEASVRLDSISLGACENAAVYAVHTYTTVQPHAVVH